MGAKDLIREQPLYVSPPSWRSMGGRYLVYGDRIELRTFFGWFNIPFSDIESLKKAPPNLARKGEKLPPDWYKSAKLDIADFAYHLELHKYSGTMRWLSFTPNDLDAFLEAVRKAGGIR